MTHRTLFPPPDENRALEQLERLHREILRARRARDRAGAEFDGFVQEFQQSQDSDAAPAGERASRRVPRPIVPPTDRPPIVNQLAKSPATAASAPQVSPASRTSVPKAAATHQEAVEPIPSLASSPRAAGRGLLLVVAAILLVGAAFAFYLWQRSQAPTVQSVTSPAAVPQQQPTPSAAPPASARPQPTPAAPAVFPSTVQLTTDRAVWMRVIVDGQKILEREVPAGQHLTYTPAGSIVIRAGDAGGVRVKIGSGPEEVLGRNAFPVTRRFDIPKP